MKINPFYHSQNIFIYLVILGLFIFSFSSVESSPLLYSTFLGGNSDEHMPFGGKNLATDTAGNVYIIGFTASSDYPTTPGAIDTTYNDYIWDIAVTKFDPSTNTLLYSTYLGGTTQLSLGYSIFVDTTGNAYIGGSSHASDFPVTMFAYSTVEQGGGDAIIMKLDPSGNMLYSTYFGGSATDEAVGVALDSAGNIIVAGGSLVPFTPGSYDTTFNDAYIAKFDPTLSNLVFSTGIGGIGQEFLTDMAVDKDGNIYVTGESFSSTVDPGSGSLDTTQHGNSDAFVFKLSADGTSLIYGTLLGGDDYDYGQGITADDNGNAYITGFSQSTVFTTTAGAWMTDTTQYFNGFITKIDPNGTSLLYSSVLLGIGYGITIDTAGNAYVTGATYNPDFPTTPGAFVQKSSYGGDVFVLKLNDTGSAPIYSSVFGGDDFFDSEDIGCEIVLDAGNTVWLTGETESIDFPVTSNAYDTTKSAYTDFFITHLSLNPVPEANFYANPSSGFAPMMVNFYDITTTGDTPTSWFWNFGDGNTSTLQNPTHTYTTIGNFNVTFVATGTYGYGSVTRNGYIQVKDVVPNFYATNTVGLRPLTVQFYDTSTGNTPVSWLWNFGDGSTSNQQNPTHTYTTTGIFDVSLTTIGVYGASSITRYDYVISFDSTETKVVNSFLAPILFHIGTDSTYCPFTFYQTSAIGIDTVTITVFNEKHPNRPYDSFISRWYRITGNGNTTGASFIMKYIQADVTDAGAVTESNLNAWRYQGGSWTKPGTSYPDTFSNVMYVYGVTSFSDWTIGIEGSTPTEAPLWELQE